MLQASTCLGRAPMEVTIRAKRFTLATLCSVTVMLCLMWSLQLNFQSFRMTSTNDIYLSSSDEGKLELMLNDALKKASTQKIILIWIAGVGRFIETKINRHNCGNCIITGNRSLIDARDTAAVVFHHRFINETDFPEKRRTDQYHVWMTGEAPPSFYKRERSLVFETEYKFNMTMTYRRDSDIYRPSSLLYKIFKVAPYRQNTILEFIRSKTKLAVAYISDCHKVPGAIERFRLLQNLRDSGLEIDLFGSCFSNRLEFEEGSRKGLLKNVSNYKFHFAFENSYHCRDYITEKFFINSLRTGAVPVVWGATLDDYLAVAPKGSFIHVEEFTTPSELIEYLHYLDKNDTAYLIYFSWKWDHKFSPLEKRRACDFCQLCRILHGINIDDIFHPQFQTFYWPRKLFSETLPTRTVHSLRKWYFKEENEECSSISKQIAATNQKI